MFSLAWLGLLCHKILPEGRTARQDLIFPIHHYSVLTGQWIPHTPPSRQFKALHLPLERRGRRVELGAHWQNLPSRCFQLNVLWSGRTFSCFCFKLPWDQCGHFIWGDHIGDFSHFHGRSNGCTNPAKRSTSCSLHENFLATSLASPVPVLLYHCMWLFLIIGKYH